jgi:alpha-beta hydrolase superfamily lysophospholipase
MRMHHFVPFRPLLGRSRLLAALAIAAALPGAAMAQAHAQQAPPTSPPHHASPQASPQPASGPPPASSAAPSPAAGSAAAPAPPPAAAAEPPPQPAACPASLPPAARCLAGRDAAGAFYWIAVPADWNQVLVVHAHGGPDLGRPTAARGQEDLQRWSVLVRAGYALAGSTYRRGGYGVTMAAEDTERVRAIFAQHVAQPRRTVLHGQSYGGGVAARALDLYGPAEGRDSPYDGALLTSGVLGGGGDAYAFRLDLRAVYQYVCRNHPGAQEPQYPLWTGLPAGAQMSREDLAARVRDCTGIGLPLPERTPEQMARLKTILDVVKIPERSLVAHLSWATFLFRDLVQQRLGGRNPFGNVGAAYQGSSDDEALNAGVARYKADPEAVAALAADSRPTGRLGLPVLTLHAIHDPIAFVELEDQYRRIVARAGSADRLVQVFTDEADHSYLSDPEYPAALSALLAWIDHGEKPSPQQVARLCAGMARRFPDGGCHIRPEFQPQPLSQRVPKRDPPVALSKK